MATVTIFGFPPSTYTRTARIAAIEKGVSYELQPLQYATVSHHALHPFGKMPILAHGAVRVFETLAILTYFDAAFEGPSLFPDAPSDLVQSMTVISAAIDYIYRPVVHNESNGGGAPETIAMMRQRALAWLSSQLEERPYLAGATASASDYVVGPMLAFSAEAVAEGDLLAEYPSLRRWLDAMLERPSFQATRPDA